ncbi:outer membrane protein assembly factor [Occallatibacter savannae]|uniref:outer membrane protein assembly factor n=1 Tax=Occallatibacter savannae TaxID=1002691 RepID=UPI000D694D35|nr:outer membrane protein assembly factor [Occallatibacter savannae]
MDAGGVVLIFFLLSAAIQLSCQLPLDALAPHSDAALFLLDPSSIYPPSGNRETRPGESLEPDRLAAWLGRPVREITFQGVASERLKQVQDHLPQQIGTPLDREKIAASLRQLYATGLFETIEATASEQGDGVRLVFTGSPRAFIGVVTVTGAKGATMNAQLVAASRLNPGTRFSENRLSAAQGRMRQALADNGFNEPKITYILKQHQEEQLVDIEFTVISGPQARVGSVAVEGDSGMTLEQFRHSAHLRAGSKVNHDTNNRALTGVLKHYQKQDRLEADVKLQSQTYAQGADRTNYSFAANRGPVVKVGIEGAKLSSDRLKRLVPVYEEGTVDEDLLNEGNRRLRDYFQRLGYFDVRVDHLIRSPEGAGAVNITYTVSLGSRRRVERVAVGGNHYFGTDTLRQLLSVKAADYLDRHGTYSQALVAGDIAALENVYHNNGFSRVKITPETLSGQDSSIPNGTAAQHRSTEPLSVIYHIDEGQQQRVALLRLDGVVKSDSGKLQGLMNTAPGQLFSPQNLAGDRDALLTDYLSRGFDQVQIEVENKTEDADATKVDVIFHIHEGQQIFVRKVLLSGLRYTRPDTVAKAITLHPGDPLSQTALADIQRNMYEFALFNEVDTAIQNPNGDETYKTVLVQTTEARRWTLTYGLGFEAQTGTPQNNCAGLQKRGETCSPNGRPGVSPRVLLDVTRNNLFGRDQSASVRGTYGLLEQNVNLLFQNPHFRGNRDWGFTFSGGYASSQDVTTYVASKLEGGFRWTEHFTKPNPFLSRANTFIYSYDFRRVKVAQESLQVFRAEIPALAAAVRVAGPGVTWIRDTRDSALDSHRGTYTTFQEFLSNNKLGSEAEFNRLDLSSSSYYGFDKNRYVLARNTRYGQERAYGPPSALLLPLPERLYAGGPTSHRGFGINGAGPRDPETGFPIGGAGALVNSTELRLPPPILPFFGDALSFVLFHDMGNVFNSAGDAWESILRVEQPNRDACKVLTQGSAQNPPVPSGQDTSTGPQGQCSFSYFSHAAGLGMRYHTPVGPIRLDFSYNLNPPIYPVNVDYALPDPYSSPHIGEAQHFNFFFSLGQTF